MTSELNLCAQEVRSVDHDQFLCGLFAPEGTADSFFALHVFEMETSNIRNKVSEPHIGLIRLQWWRDLVAGCYDGTQGEIDTSLHREIAAVLKTKTIDQTLLARYLNARQFDMEDRPPQDLPALLLHCAATGGLMAQVKSQAMGHTANEAQVKIGTAASLTTILRTMAYQARHMRHKIPKSMIELHQLDLKFFSELTCTNALKHCVHDLVVEIERLITQARQQRSETSPVMLQTVAIEDYIKRLKKVDYDPFNPNLGTGRLQKQLRLMYLALRKRY